jgi:hypothetical protein
LEISVASATSNINNKMSGSSNVHRSSEGLPVPPLSTPREQAHASLAVSSDATALPAVVSTPTAEIAHPFFATGAQPDAQSEDSATRQRKPSTHANGHSSALNGVADNLRQIANASSISTRSSSLKRTNAAVSLQDAAAAGTLHSPVCFPAFDTVADGENATLQASTASTSKMVLELVDGTAFQGFSFGAKGKSISGECVFQTGKLFHCLSTPLYPPFLPLSNDECYVGTSL